MLGPYLYGPEAYIIFPVKTWLEIWLNCSYIRRILSEKIDNEASLLTHTRDHALSYRERLVSRG